MNSTSLITVAGPGHRGTVADTVAEAFLSLDVIRHLVPEDGRRRDVSRGWYQLYIDHAIDGAGRVDMIDDRAAAVWLDHTGKANEPKDYAARLAAATGKDLPRFEHLDAQMEAHHPRDPHWYLLFLAVRPKWQGKGLGSLLLDHFHERIDDQGYPAYLEATGDDNERLYQEHGYKLMTPPAVRVTDSLHLRRMWRSVQNG